MIQMLSVIRPVREVARPTTIIDASRLSRQLGVNVTLASETFQHTGSFKFRAAYNVAAKVPQELIIAASSGNFWTGAGLRVSASQKTLHHRHAGNFSENENRRGARVRWHDRLSGRQNKES